MDDSSAAEALMGASRALSEFLIGSEPLDSTLRRVAGVAVDAYAAARFAGISTLVDGEPQTAVFTDEEAVEIDAAQYRSGDGPCLDSFREGVVNRVDDTDGCDRWIEFCEAAASHGIRSTVSFPMVAGDETTGALNLYSPELGGFVETDDELGLALARQAAVLLANSQAYWDAFDLTEDLQTAMRSRAVIEQAKGILMSQTPRLDEDAAFDVLRSASQRENVKLREIARRIVDRRGQTEES